MRRRKEHRVRFAWARAYTLGEPIPEWKWKLAGAENALRRTLWKVWHR